MPESFSMNGGGGEYSYTKNSHYQREASNIAKELIEEAILEKLDINSLLSTSNTFRITDLGCSVGPNTIIAMQNVIKAVENRHYSLHGSKTLDYQVFFNDHVSNDFNTLFASLTRERKYFVAGVPGSFHHRLFPSSSIHFAHSSYSLQWLSEVPEKLLDKNSLSWNKGKIHYTGAADEVVSAYAAQFEMDMESFLKARAEEIVIGGMVVLIIPGIPDEVRHSDLHAGILFTFLGSSLVEMASEGILDESQIDSFNLPIYSPSPKEIASLVEKNGCFSIEKMEITDPMSKIEDPLNVQSLLMHLRAAMEGIFTEHFGSEAVEEMFKRTASRGSDISMRFGSGYHKGTQLFVVLKRK